MPSIRYVIANRVDSHSGSTPGSLARGLRAYVGEQALLFLSLLVPDCTVSHRARLWYAYLIRRASRRRAGFNRTWNDLSSGSRTLCLCILHPRVCAFRILPSRIHFLTSICTKLWTTPATSSDNASGSFLQKAVSDEVKRPLGRRICDGHSNGNGIGLYGGPVGIQASIGR